MLRLALISLFSLVAGTAHAETVGSYSKCKNLGANAGTCTSCLRSGQMFNFDNARKKWVCGDTRDMTKSKPVSKKTTVNKQPQKPSSVKKR